MTLREKIEKERSGILLYGLTPPKQSTSSSKALEIAQKQIYRLKDTGIDGVVLYDLQDESSRNTIPRPFPFMETMSPDDYSNLFLNDLKLPKILYKSVGNYTPTSFRKWLSETNTDFSVFVGSPSHAQKNELSLPQAYALRSDMGAGFLLGGVTIPERHAKSGDEHLRIIKKTEAGCNFFISQCIYNVNNAKNVLSDYYYYSQQNNIALSPIIFTLTPCGSKKTLEFMQWLGIEVPKWLYNELSNSHNILQESLNSCKAIAAELAEFAERKDMPIGFNVESVSIRKEEIDASVELLFDVKRLTNSLELSMKQS